MPSFLSISAVNDKKGTDPLGSKIPDGILGALGDENAVRLVGRSAQGFTVRLLPIHFPERYAVTIIP